MVQERERGVDLSLFFQIAKKLIELLSSIHDQDVNHQDLTPHNIIIDSTTVEPIIIDFGVSCLQTLGRKRTIDARTLPFMACEQTGRVDQAIDHRTDLYAVGVTFYYLLTGCLPFESTDPSELLHCILAVEPPSISEPQIPPIVCKIIMKLLMKTSEDRYQSAYGLLMDLRRTEMELDGGRDPHTIDFSLGLHDVRGRIVKFKHLYGRQDVISDISENFFAMTRRSVPSIALINGPAGIGKSTAVRAACELIKSRSPHVMLVKSKLDQFKVVPYACFKPIIQELLSSILSKPSAQVKAWSDRLLEAMGSNGSLLIALFPLLESIVGAQPQVTSLPPLESQKRLSILFTQFMVCFCDQNAPLIFFFDDVQWADTNSLQQIADLCQHPSCHSISFILSYRNEQMSNGALQNTIEMLSHHPLYHNITLSELGISEVEQMLEDMFHLKDAQSLVTLLHSKSKGNPFFVVQLLQSMLKQKLLTYHADDVDKPGRWHWDIQQLMQFFPSKDVLQLVQENMSRLEAKTQHLLRIAACIGNRFEIGVLSIVSETPFQEVLPMLLDMQLGGFVKQMNMESPSPPQDSDNSGKSYSDTSYNFVHDKIQQSAYESIPKEDRPMTHLKIGCLALEAAEQDPHIFKSKCYDIANHFGLSIQELKRDRPDLLLKVAIFFHWITKKAYTGGGYAVALSYCQSGLALLNIDVAKAVTCLEHLSGKESLPLAITLLTQYAEISFLCGEPMKAKEILQILLKQTLDMIQKSNLYYNLIVVLASQNDWPGSIAVYKEALIDLGVPEEETGLCEESRQGAINADLITKVEAMRGDRSIVSLIDLPACNDPRQLLLSSLYASIGFVAAITNPTLQLFLAYQSLYRAMKYGWVGNEGYAIVLLGSVLVIQGKLKQAWETGQLGLAVGKFARPLIIPTSDVPQLTLDIVKVDHVDVPDTSCRGWTAAPTFIMPWIVGLDEAYDVATRALALTLEQGDAAFYTNGVLSRLLFSVVNMSLKDFCQHLLKDVSEFRRVQPKGHELGNIMAPVFAIAFLHLNPTLLDSRAKRFFGIPKIFEPDWFPGQFLPSAKPI
eukprot:TRINITY_DN15151_c0_g1_i1.p1 TRINITY_DN15151_c0_g1~~TRINITY_DN15151_c0_g1_i1.p1  ORF type:complete len:1166 (+),score=305.03 TRINITY_DN15151_c0_g1_i1:293-3499(+)